MNYYPAFSKLSYMGQLFLLAFVGFSLRERRISASALDLIFE